MHLKRSILGVSYLCCISSLVACNGMPSAFSGGNRTRLDAQLRPILHQRHTEGVVVAARIVEVKTGRELYAENADQQMTPASNMKILVTAAALDYFGPDHAFKTYLVRDGEDLWIIGNGDPGIGDPAIAARRGGDTLTVLDEWVTALSRPEGLGGSTTTIRDIYYYDAALDDQQIHETWGKDDLVHWYAAPISGLNFNDNCIDVTIYPTEPGQPVRYEVMPPVKNIKIINNCITGADEDPAINRAPDANVYTISGGAKRKTSLRSKPVTNPGEFFADALRTHMESNGLKISGEIKRGQRPPYGMIDPPPSYIAVHETTVRELLPRINKNSQNLLAEGLCKLLGRAYDHERWRPGPGSWSSGSDAIHAFLERMGIDHSGIVVADGSGLSRQNRVTTRAISDLLVKMRSHEHGDVLFDSMSVGGVDGTIRSRFTDKPGMVHAKTGFIGGVRSLSGYLPSRRGEIVFSIIYNGFRGSARPYEQLQDHAVRLLMTYPNLDYVPPTTQPATQPSTRPATQPVASMTR